MGRAMWYVFLLAVGLLYAFGLVSTYPNHKLIVALGYIAWITFNTAMYVQGMEKK